MLAVEGTTRVVVEIPQTGKRAELLVYCVPNLEMDIDILLGHDAHAKLGAALIWKFNSDKVEYVGAVCKTESHEEKVHPEIEMPGSSVVTECIDELDFTLARARRDDSSDYRWVVRYKWADGPPPCNVGRYRGSSALYRKPWINEGQVAELVERWTSEGILRPIAESEVKFVIPLNPVRGSDSKSTKIRLTMDYSELNKYLVEVRSTETNEDCLQKIREWRLKGSGTIMDVRQAYLSVELAEEEQAYHCVKFRDKYYRMTRLAFGVQSGPRVLFIDGARPCT